MDSKNQDGITLLISKDNRAENPLITKIIPDDLCRKTRQASPMEYRIRLFSRICIIKTTA